MARPEENLEYDVRLVELQKMSSTRYPLSWLKHFVEEWEQATRLIRGKK